MGLITEINIEQFQHNIAECVDNARRHNAQAFKLCNFLGIRTSEYLQFRDMTDDHKPAAAAMLMHRQQHLFYLLRHGAPSKKTGNAYQFCAKLSDIEMKTLFGKAGICRVIDHAPHEAMKIGIKKLASLFVPEPTQTMSAEMVMHMPPWDDTIMDKLFLQAKPKERSFLDQLGKAHNVAPAHMEPPVDDMPDNLQKFYRLYGP